MRRQNDQPPPTTRRRGLSLVARIFIIGVVGAVGALTIGVISTIGHARNDAALDQISRIRGAAITSSVVQRQTAEVAAAQLAYACLLYTSRCV